VSRWVRPFLRLGRGGRLGKRRREIAEELGRVWS
jgi:hypothetical protein